MTVFPPDHVFAGLKYGSVFGDRVVIGPAASRNGARFLQTRCKCGTESDVARAHLMKGKGHRCKVCAVKNQTGAKSRAWLGGKHLPRTLLNKWRRSAIRRNIIWEIDTDFLDALIEQQDWKCALSGQALIFDHGERNGVDRGNASLDRIENAKGYIGGNVQFVTKAVNMAKQALSESDFIKMCVWVTWHRGDI